MAERNRAALRQLVMDQLDWAPSASAEQVARFDRALNRAQNELSKDLPGALFKRVGWFDTWPDHVPTNENDTISVVSSPALDTWVFQRDLPLETIETGVDAWTASYYWGTRILEIEDSTGVWRRHHVRMIAITGVAPTRYYHVSLYEPWVSSGTTGLRYRFTTDTYYLPHDVLTVEALRLLRAGGSQPLSIVDPTAAKQALIVGVNTADTSTGVPTHAFREPPFAMPAPTKAPTVAAAAGAWSATLEPQGAFMYCYTYCWGQRVRQHEPGPLAQGSMSALLDRYVPIWESAPSPVSASIISGSTEITVTTPDIDFMQGFGDSNKARYHLSGWFKRIYRKRSSVTGGANQQIETPSTYFLLDEIPGYTTAFTDNGAVTPDYSVRLPDIGAYQGVRLHPKPDAVYTVEVAYTRRPLPMTDDSDTPGIDAGATEALILLTAAYVYESLGNHKAKADKLAEYEDELITCRKRYGDLRPPSQPALRRLATARGRTRFRTP